MPVIADPSLSPWTRSWVSFILVTSLRRVYLA
jgi:hypothetical protein